MDQIENVGKNENWTKLKIGQIENWTKLKVGQN